MDFDFDLDPDFSFLLEMVDFCPGEDCCLPGESFFLDTGEAALRFWLFLAGFLAGDLGVFDGLRILRFIRRLF